MTILGQTITTVAPNTGLPEPTERSRDLLLHGSSLDRNTAKDVLMNSTGLIGDVNLDDDEVVEWLLNVQGWEILHTLPAVSLLFMVTTLIPFQVL